jgi:YHS domain-containing protein
VGEEMSERTLDPVCGMPVDERRAAASTVVQGRTYYFCSVSCAQRFQEEPSKFIGPDATEIRL